MSERLKDIFTHYVFLPCFKEKRPLESFLEWNWSFAGTQKSPQEGAYGLR